MVDMHLEFSSPSQITTILKGIRITNYRDISAILRELKALMICEWNVFHGMDPLTIEE